MLNGKNAAAKVLHVNTERTWRGGEQQCMYLLQGLERRAIECHLACQLGSPMESRAQEIDIKVFSLRMRSEVDFAAIGYLRKLIRKEHYDLIHSHTSHAHTLAFLASAGLHTNRLVTRRVDFSIFRHSFLRLSGIKYRYMADYYIAISHKIKEVLVGDGIAPDRIFVVHSGIDVQRFRESSAGHLIREFELQSQEQVVVNVAHLAGHKGQRHLIKAIPLVLKEVPNVRFFIVGGGDLRSDLEQLANSLELKDKVIFTGFRKDVGAFYKLADLFVMSSVQEGLGTAVLDALALGIPVVATEAGGIPEYIKNGKTGKLVPPGDHEALAEGIVYMLKNGKEARRMADEGKVLVRNHFSVQAMVNNNLKVYQKILRDGNVRPCKKS